jgi:hypothetical protein
LEPGRPQVPLLKEPYLTLDRSGPEDGSLAVLFGVCLTALILPLIFTAALALFTFGIIQVPESGWLSPYVPVLFFSAAFGTFVVIEMRASRPVLDLSLFRYPRFVGRDRPAAKPAGGSSRNRQLSKGKAA